MVNATEMAKPFGKSVKDWTRLQSTTDYLNALKSVKGHISLIESKIGNPATGGGTWMHEDVALEFARWLSPEILLSSALFGVEGQVQFF